MEKSDFAKQKLTQRNPPAERQRVTTKTKSEVESLICCDFVLPVRGQPVATVDNAITISSL